MSKIEQFGVSFEVVDPASYPFAQYEFTDEHDFKKFWNDLGPDDICLDLGASFGGWTMLALAKGATVTAVEPSPISGAILEENVRLNHWGRRFTLLKALFWDSTPVPHDFWQFAVQCFGGSPSVALMQLDDFEGLDKFTRIKFDVEGAELPIIRGGKKYLARHKPDLIIEDHDNPKLSYTNGLRALVKKELDALGYNVLEYYGQNGGNPFLIATHKEKA